MSGSEQSFYLPVSVFPGGEGTARFVLQEGYEILGWVLEKDNKAEESGPKLQYSIEAYSGSAESNSEKRFALEGALGVAVEVKEMKAFHLDVNGKLSREASDFFKTSHQCYTILLRVKSTGFSACFCGKRGEGCITLKVNVQKKQPALKEVVSSAELNEDKESLIPNSNQSNNTAANGRSSKVTQGSTTNVGDRTTTNHNHHYGSPIRVTSGSGNVTANGKGSTVVIGSGTNIGNTRTVTYNYR